MHSSDTVQRYHHGNGELTTSSTSLDLSIEPHDAHSLSNTFPEHMCVTPCRGLNSPQRTLHMLQGLKCFLRENCRSDFRITQRNEPQVMFKNNLSRHYCACVCLLCSIYICESCISKNLHRANVIFVFLSHNS